MNVNKLEHKIFKHHHIRIWKSEIGLCYNLTLHQFIFWIGKRTCLDGKNYHGKFISIE